MSLKVGDIPLLFSLIVVAVFGSAESEGKNGKI
jgi:hypothetical protein